MENNMKNTDIEVIKKVVIFTTNQGINISELSLKFNDDRKLLAHSINMCVNLMVYIEQSEARKEEVTVETIIRDISGINHEFVRDVMDRYTKDGRKAIMKILAEHKANGIEMNNDVSDVVDLMIQEVFPNRDNDKSMGQEAANIIEMCLKYNLRTELGELFEGLRKIDTKTTFLFAVDEGGNISTAGNASMVTLIKLFISQSSTTLSEVENESDKNAMMLEVMAKLYTAFVTIGGCEHNLQRLSDYLEKDINDYIAMSTDEPDTKD